MENSGSIIFFNPAQVIALQPASDGKHTYIYTSSETTFCAEGSVETVSEALGFSFED